MGKILALLVLASAPAFADPSPTCYCERPYHPFGSGPDATAWNQIIPGGHTYCFRDANATTEDDTAGNFRPCGVKPAETPPAPQGQGSTPPTTNTKSTTSRAVELSNFDDPSTPPTGSDKGTATSAEAGSLAFNLHLTSESDCEEKLKSLSAISPVFSISGGPVGTGALSEEQQKPYCQKLFPSGAKSGPFDVVAAATPTFQDENDCETKVTSALEVSSSVQYADTAGKLVAIPDPVSYCRTIFPLARQPRTEISNIQ